MSIATWFVTPVTVKPYNGEGSAGPSYGDEQTVMVYVKDEIRLVRDKNGDEVVSASTLYAALSDAAAFAPESLVTLVDGHGTTRVISAARRRGRRSPRLDHVEVVLE